MLSMQVRARKLFIVLPIRRMVYMPIDYSVGLNLSKTYLSMGLELGE